MSVTEIKVKKLRDLEEILVAEKAAADVPASVPGKQNIFVDTADSKLKLKDDLGDVSVVASESYVDSAVSGVGMDWADPVDANIVPAANNTYNLGGTSESFAKGYINQVSNITESDYIKFDGGNVEISSDTSVNLVSQGTIVLNPTLTGVEVKATGAIAPVKLYDEGGSNYVSLEAPMTLAAPVALKLPSSAGINGDVLTTDGAGGMSWTTPSGAMNWAAPVDSDIIPDEDLTYNLGAEGSAFSTMYVDEITNTGNTDTINLTDQIELYSNNQVVVTSTQNITLTGESINIYGFSGGNTCPLRFRGSTTSNYVALQAPDTVSSDTTYVLPAADGSAGQVLSTDGAGILSWASAGGPAFEKTSKTYTDFSTAATFFAVAIKTLAVKEFATKAYIHYPTSWTGSTVINAKLKIQGGADITSNLDLTPVQDGSKFLSVDLNGIGDFTNTMTIELEVSSDVNLDTLTGGFIDVYLMTEVLP